MKTYLDILFESIGLTEDVIPATAWGYWIGPKGEFIPVESHGHAKAARKLGMSMADMVKAGYVRVLTWSGSLSIAFAPGKPSNRTMSAIRRLVMSEDWRAYTMEMFEDGKSIDDDHPLYGVSTRLYKDARDFMAAAQTCAEPRQIAPAGS